MRTTRKIIISIGAKGGVGCQAQNRLLRWSLEKDPYSEKELYGLPILQSIAVFGTRSAKNGAGFLRSIGFFRFTRHECFEAFDVILFDQAIDHQFDSR